MTEQKVPQLIAPSKAVTGHQNNRKVSEYEDRIRI